MLGRFKMQKKKTIRYNSLRSISHLQTISMFFFLLAVSVFDPCLPNNDSNSSWQSEFGQLAHARNSVLAIKTNTGADWYVSSMNPLIHQDFEYFSLWSFVVPGTLVTLTITSDMRLDKTTRQQIESKLFLRSNRYRFGLYTWMTWMPYKGRVNSPVLYKDH